jgi:monofunctional glycosyltransferase
VRAAPTRRGTDRTAADRAALGRAWRRSRGPRRRPGRRLAAALLKGTGWLVLLTALLVLALRWVPPPTSSVMVQHRLARLLGTRPVAAIRYRWVPWAEIAPQVAIAVVASEDQRFPTHHGFDLAAIHAVVAAREPGDRMRGASTISQQVAKNMFLWSGRSWLRKGLEAYFTVLLETLWPKRRILEVYLNVAQFGDGVFGVGAASAAFFHKPPARLDDREAALLAAVLPNPHARRADAPSPAVRERAAWVRRQVALLGGPRYLSGL